MHRCCLLWQLLSFWLWLHCVQSKTSMFAQLTMSFTMLCSWASENPFTIVLTLNKFMLWVKVVQYRACVEENLHEQAMSVWRWNHHPSTSSASTSCRTPWPPPPPPAAGLPRPPPPPAAGLHDLLRLHQLRDSFDLLLHQLRDSLDLLHLHLLLDSLALLCLHQLRGSPRPPLPPPAAGLPWPPPPLLLGIMQPQANWRGK